MLHDFLEVPSNYFWCTNTLYWYDKFYIKKPVWTSLFKATGPIRTGPTQSSWVHSIYGLVQDQLWLWLPDLEVKKPDWTRPWNTSVLWFPQPHVLVRSSSCVVIAMHHCHPALSLHLAVRLSLCHVVVVSLSHVCTTSLAHLGSMSPVSVCCCLVSQQSGLGQTWHGGYSPWCQK